MRSSDVGVIDFPTLGDLLDAWYEQHCFVPGGVLRGAPFKQYDWQFWCSSNFYRVREDIDGLDGVPILNQAFVYRRAQVVAPQKTGKGPWDACLLAGEAVGPSQYAGWAEDGDVYRCSENGCPCGWEYPYLEGEPKGMRHPSPLLQILATSEDQAEMNVYGPLKAMVRLGPLKNLLLVREGFMRIVGQNADDPDLDRIDVVSASATSRIGNPISFAVQDETGLYTKSNRLMKVSDAQRRGAAGMGGRTIETTNAWDPAEDSVAQRTYEAQADDIFRFYRDPDREPALRGADGKPLSYASKANRRKIHAYVYKGSDHVNLDSIEAEAAEIAEKDPAQAERFFGNRVVAGGGAWMPRGMWEARRADVVASESS